MIRGLLGIFIITVSLSACAPKSKNKVLLKKDLGVLVRINSPSDLKILTSSSSSYEKIGLNIYRVLDLSKAELQNILPYNDIADDMAFKEEPVSTTNEIEPDDTFFDLQGCDPEAKKPLPIVDIPAGKEKFVLDSINLGAGAVKISAKKSLNAEQYEKERKKNKLGPPTFGTQFTNLLNGLTDLFQNNTDGLSKLRFSWRLTTPLGSTISRKFENVLELNFTPDKAGGYTFYLRADDLESGGCMIAPPLVIGATTNQTFKKMTAMGSVNPSDFELSQFPHLGAIGADKAWKESQGEGVVIAILDSGVNYNHPDLNQNIKLNEKEIPDNKIDDDKNGLIDDVYGYDFAFKDNQPFSDEPHGTHVAGLAAGRKFGVGKKALILPIKVATAAGRTPMGQLIQGIVYAVDQGAKVINLSLGIAGAPEDLKGFFKSAFDYAESKGVIIVSAAGNSSRPNSPINNDYVLTLPANMENPNNIAVAATDLSGNLTTYSQFGLNTVDVAAPGGTETEPLRSTFSDLGISTYIKLSGTSMATPIVSGVIALMISKNPHMEPSEIREILISTSVPTNNLLGKVTSQGLINAEQALKATEPDRRLAQH